MLLAKGAGEWRRTYLVNSVSVVLSVLFSTDFDTEMLNMPIERVSTLVAGGTIGGS